MPFVTRYLIMNLGLGFLLFNNNFTDFSKFCLLDFNSISRHNNLLTISFSALVLSLSRPILTSINSSLRLLDLLSLKSSTSSGIGLRLSSNRGLGVASLRGIVLLSCEKYTLLSLLLEQFSHFPASFFAGEFRSSSLKSIRAAAGTVVS